MDRAVITFDGVQKYYGDHHALRDVSFNVPAGQTLVICGPSGSGKSTLIRCINGLEGFSSGRISVLGHDVGDDLRTLDLVRRQVGMVFQHFNLFPHLTIFENCILPQMRAVQRSRPDATERAIRQLSRMRVVEHGSKFPDQISGGQQQRVALARALCLDPKIMLLDEPTSALDPEMVSEMLDVMRELAETDMTVLCVTHEMGFARGVADEVMLMAEGRVIERGPPEQMFDAPQEPQTREFMKALRL